MDDQGLRNDAEHEPTALEVFGLLDRLIAKDKPQDRKAQDIQNRRCQTEVEHELFQRIRIPLHRLFDVFLFDVVIRHAKLGKVIEDVLHQKPGDGYIHPLGWTNTGYNTRIYSEAADNKATNTGISAVNNLAMMSKNNTTYGETTGYTMPLKAATIYKITFKYCGWGNTPTTNIVLTDPESNTITLAPGFRPATNNGNTNAENWYSYSGYFVSTTAGNYVLAMNKVESGQQQIGIGDIELVTASEIEFSEDADAPAYAPGTYPNVTLTRTIKANTWNTFVVPFAISNAELVAKFGADVAVAEYSETADGDNSTVSFTKMATPAVAANTPVLLKTSTAGTSYTFPARSIVVGDAKVAGTKNFDFVGNYNASLALVDGDYFISSDKLYKKGESATVTLKGTRAYIQPKSVGVKVLNFIIGDEIVTGVDSVEAVEAEEDGVLYNIAGQVVTEDYKGIVIKNGKKYYQK